MVYLGATFCYNILTMKVIIKEKNKYILRFDPGDEVIGGLQDFCQSNGISLAYFSGIGASSNLVLSIYDRTLKRYKDKNFDEDLEIAGITGNITNMDNQPMIHCHGSFGRSDFSTVSGHIKSLVISVTCEIVLVFLEGTLERGLDTDLNLQLMK